MSCSALGSKLSSPIISTDPEAVTHPITKIDFTNYYTSGHLLSPFFFSLPFMFLIGLETYSLEKVRRAHNFGRHLCGSLKNLR